MELVTDETAREARADAALKKARKREAQRKPAGRSRPVPKKFQALVTDIARLDLARWLWRQRRGATDGAPPPPSDESTAAGNDRGASPDDGGRVMRQSAGGDDPSTGSSTGSRLDATEQVELLAQRMAEATWADITAEIAASTGDATTVRRQFANHFWCDLFVAFARVAEDLHEGVQEIPDSAKDLIKRSVHGSSRQSARSALSDHIVDFAVERAWTALRTTTFGAVPLLAVLTGDELLRSLRILAVFICPAPEEHAEVRIYAVKPLTGDARDYLTEETKTQLTESFPDFG